MFIDYTQCATTSDRMYHVLLKINWNTQNAEILTIEQSEESMKKAVKLLQMGGFSTDADLKVLSYAEE